MGIAALLLSVAALFLVANWLHSVPPAYDMTQGKILELREAIDGTRETQYGGKIRYRIDAHVQYVVDGQAEDRWLRASDDLSPESLAVKLNAHPTQCLVYWLPNHSETAKCSLK